MKLNITTSPEVGTVVIDADEYAYLKIMVSRIASLRTKVAEELGNEKESAIRLNSVGMLEYSRLDIKDIGMLFDFDDYHKAYEEVKAIISEKKEDVSDAE